jgi:twitching motility protein PilT
MDYKSELNELVLTLVKEEGSDLHLIVGAPPVLRVNSELINLLHKEPLKSEDTVNFLRAMVSERMFNDFVIKQELDFSFEHLGEYRLRGNAYFQKGLVGVSLRLVPKPRTFEELQLPAILSEIAHEKQGLFLVVGPVRQGKSTTLATMVNEINSTERKHIVTIEDPIEYIFENDKSVIDQREIGMDTSSFHLALKQAFRQDVDVIMLGEMRDIDTISAAVTAAETGHLVLSTLHTNSASQTINRIIDSFPAEQQEQVRLQLGKNLLFYL